MRNADFLERLAFDGVTQRQIEGDGGVPGVEDDLAIATLGGFSLECIDKLAAEALALERGIHSYLPHLGDAIASGQQCAGDGFAIDEPDDVDVVDFSGEIFVGELPSEGPAKDAPAKHDFGGVLFRTVMHDTDVDLPIITGRTHE